MGGIFGGTGAGGTPPAAGGMTGFDANAVAQALAALGKAPQSGVTPGIPEKMANPLAAMLKAQGPTYQPSDTSWGLKGDRLMRFTPQEGLRGQADGAGGGVNVPNGVDTTIDWSKVTPSTPPIQIGNTTINPGNLASAVAKPTTDPTGAPSINDAMQKLQPTSAPGARPPQSVLDQNVIATRAAWNAAKQQPEGFRKMSQAQKAAWAANVTAAERAYVDAQKASGYGPGAEPIYGG